MWRVSILDLRLFSFVEDGVLLHNFSIVFGVDDANLYKKVPLPVSVLEFVELEFRFERVVVARMLRDDLV